MAKNSVNQKRKGNRKLSRKNPTVNSRNNRKLQGRSQKGGSEEKKKNWQYH